MLFSKTRCFYGGVKKWIGLRRLNRKGSEKMHNNERERYVVEELQKQGYPATAIKPDWKSGSSRMDFVVFAQKANISLMIVEVMSAPKTGKVDIVLAQMKQYGKSM